MATTGLELSKIFDQKIGQAYTGYLDAIKKTRLFKEALFTAVENKAKMPEDQKVNDELFSILKTSAVFTTIANKIYVSGVLSPLIPDYMHLRALKVKFTKAIDGISISGATNTNPIVVTTATRNNIRSKNLITITGVTGNTSANGTFYIKVLTPSTFSLYADINLLVPVAGNGAYLSGGAIAVVIYKYAKPFLSDRKIGTFGQPTVYDPKFEIADGQIKIYPETEAVQEITIDYVSKPYTLINPVDNTEDLEITYPIKFLYYVLDIAKGMFAEQVRDNELIQLSSIDTVKNQ